MPWPRLIRYRDEVYEVTLEGPNGCGVLINRTRPLVREIADLERQLAEKRAALQGWYDAEPVDVGFTPAAESP